MGTTLTDSLNVMQRFGLDFLLFDGEEAADDIDDEFLSAFEAELRCWRRCKRRRSSFRLYLSCVEYF